MAPLDDAERAAWHAARSKVVGASEVAALFGVSPHTSHWALWQIKAGRVAPPNLGGDERVRWGLRLEDAIADAVGETKEWEIRPGGHRTSKGTPGLGCTLDREAVCPTRGLGCLELKNVDWLVRKREWGAEPPAHILLQLQAQLAVTRYRWGAVAALVGGNELRVWEYEMRPKVIAQIEARVKAFWRSIREGREPPVDGSASTAETLATLFPVAAVEMVDMRDDNELPEACAGFLRAREARQAAEREEAHYAATIKAKAGDAAAVMVAGYSVRLPEVPAIPDRVAQPGEVIRGRAGYRRLTVKEYLG